MKIIYFIRHGESEGNTGPVRQDGFSSLSDRGREQAVFIAERCSKLSIDILVASTMTRAQQTAAIVGEKIGKEVVSSDLFTERRRPSAQTGKPKENPEALAIDKEIWNNFGTAGYRHSDEENCQTRIESASSGI